MLEVNAKEFIETTESRASQNLLALALAAPQSLCYKCRKSDSHHSPAFLFIARCKRIYGEAISEICYDSDRTSIEWLASQYLAIKQEEEPIHICIRESSMF